MDEEDIITFSCSLCDKTYPSRTSLLNHNRIKHKLEPKQNKITEKCYQCKYCKACYAYPQSRWLHQKKCKIDKEDEALSQEERDNNVLEEMRIMKEQIVELQNKLLKSKRLDNKTFKAVNKILMDKSYRNSQNNNTNSNNITNNYQILTLGNEELVKALTYKQKKQIINSRLGSLERIVEIAHCGDMNQFKNIIVTNLKDSYAYRYDDKKGYFVTVPKNVLLENVVAHRVTDIEAIYDELHSANKIDPKTKKIIQDFFDRMNNDEMPYYDNDMKYDNFKTFKIDNIKILLYNNQDKITKDIALLISDDT